MSQHIALLFNLGVLKNCMLALKGQLPPCPPASYGPDRKSKRSRGITPTIFSGGCITSAPTLVLDILHFAMIKTWKACLLQSELCHHSFYHFIGSVYMIPDPFGTGTKLVQISLVLTGSGTDWIC